MTRPNEWTRHGAVFGPRLVELRQLTESELAAFGSCTYPTGEHADWHDTHRHLARRRCPYAVAFSQIAARKHRIKKD